MSERRTIVFSVAALTLVLTVAAVLLARSWADEPRQFLSSVPQPSPLTKTDVVPVGPGERACLTPVTILPSSEVALLRIGTRRKPGVDVSVVASAPGGYRTTDRVAGTEWKDNDLLSFTLQPPPRPVHGSFCLSNDGERTVDVYASEDRTKSFAVTRVAGRRRGGNIQLAFAERDPGTVEGHANEIADKVTVFRPGIIGSGLVWVLGGLVFLALTLGVGAAMLLAVRSDQRAEPTRTPARRTPIGGSSGAAPAPPGSSTRKPIRTEPSTGS